MTITSLGDEAITFSPDRLYTAVAIRTGSTRPERYRLAQTDDGLVLQGEFHWREDTYDPATNRKAWTGGSEWIEIPTVDLRTKVPA